MTKKRPHILITNDDGIHAPGIKHLWNAVKHFADVTIVAPASEQSGVGLSITTRSPLHVQPYEWPEKATAYSVTGTPADCVKMGLRVVLKSQPDLILSGINRGTNSGRNILYSGTIAGVIEGLMHNIPGIAISCFDMHDANYEETQTHIATIAHYILDHPLPHGTFLNVNFPPTNKGKVKGFKLARQGKQYWAENLDARQHPVEKHHYYWLGAKLAEFDEHEDSDVTWLNRGYMTAVPVHIGELTDLNLLQERKSLFENLYKN